MLDVVRDAAGSMNRYPDMAVTELTAALAARLDVPAERLAIGPGSVGVLGQLIAATCDPGDEVVFAWRSFEAYPILVTLAGAVPVQVPLGRRRPARPRRDGRRDHAADPDGARVHAEQPDRDDGRRLRARGLPRPGAVATCSS